MRFSSAWAVPRCTVLRVPVRMRSAVSGSDSRNTRSGRSDPITRIDAADHRGQPGRPGQVHGGLDLVGDQAAGPPPEQLVEQLLAVADPPVQRGARHAQPPGQRPHVQPASRDERGHGRREDLGRDQRGPAGPLGQDGEGVLP